MCNPDLQSQPAISAQCSSSTHVERPECVRAHSSLPPALLIAGVPCSKQAKLLSPLQHDSLVPLRGKQVHVTILQDLQPHKATAILHAFICL